jgi:hypothetical protein
MSVNLGSRFDGFTARIAQGFYLGVMDNRERIPQDALLFFDGDWVLYRGCRFRNPQFRGAVAGRWVIRASPPPFTWGDLLDSDGLEEPYSTIVQVFWEAPGRWRGLDDHGQLVAHLTDQSASDVFRCRQWWEGDKVLVES